MSYAVEAKQKAIDETPAIVHVDNTCRVQTLNKDFNKNYYDLINEFYKKTNVPLLLNTSFNLAGFPIPEKIDKALEICEVKNWDIYLTNGI
jgi:carbamoyltransferase